MTYTQEMIKAAGGRIWEKNGMIRGYFNDLAEIYGLKIERYNTGNIRNAKVNGEYCSNSEARRLIDKMGMGDGKLWYDFGDQKFHGRGIDDEMFHELVSIIKKKMGVE